MPKITKLKRLDQKTDASSLTKVITSLAMNVFGLLVVEYLLDGVMFSDLRAAIVAAVVIGIVNTYIRPVLQIIALPFSIITLGLTAFLVNVLLLWFSASIVPGFEIDSFMTAAAASILLTLISWFLHRLALK